MCGSWVCCVDWNGMKFKKYNLMVKVICDFNGFFLFVF